MRATILCILLLFFSFSCRTSNQDKVSNENSDSLPGLINENPVFNADSIDIAIFQEIISYARQKQLNKKVIAEIELELARQFIGTPYVGHTLEKDSMENLVINLHELDCTTFMENVIALSLCIKNKKTSFVDYCKTLVKLRYRDEKIDAYPSRLHYTTDWLMNNQEKRLIKIVSNDFGPVDFDPRVNFMSTHPELYKQLANNEYVEQIRAQEKNISSCKLKFVPKEKIKELAIHIKNGDIIAISTTVPGLDFSHVAIAAWKDDELHFYHASSSEKEVVLSDKSLYEYLAGMKHSDGIVVGRLINPD